MVAFVTGSGLGLQNTSLKLMGSDQAAAGNPNTGRALEQVYVNAANGNLIIQRQDDLLVSAGIDMVSLRTYNSQGVIAADKLNSGWRMSAVMSLANASAGINPNAAGSQILRTDRDGSSYLYAYNSSGAYAGKYTRADDPGARDVMSYASGSKRWTLDEGDSHAIHLFDWNNNAGKLQSSADADGNTISYSYNNDGAVTAIRDSASNESITYAYTSKLLTQVTTTRGNGSIVRVRYSYETYQVGGTNYQRLQTVRTDLSPDDSSVADGRVYEIGYEYLASSNQVSAITQTDGTRLKFDYDNARRVTAITQTSADGVTRTTQLSYGAGNTVIQDALGNRTTFTYDAANRLIGLLGPDGASHSYSYDDFDNLTSQTDGRGNVITYAYDDNGNQIRQQWGTGSSSGSGRTITRTYGARNQLLCETRYEGVDPDHGGSAAPLGAQTTRYVYNAQNHLIFEISPEGRVTEHRYDSKGLRSATLRHGGARYSASGTPTEAGMNGWVAALTDHAHSTRSDMSYDSRGLLASVTRYAALDASGNGVAAGKAVTTYVHDQAGLLLKTVSANGNATASASAGSTVYTYDGLGRRLSTTDALGNLGITLYNDAGRTDTTTEANGLLVTRVYNRAGELVTMTRSDSANALGSTRYWYDANGRLRMSEDPTGVRRHVLYDGAGRKLADIDGAGRLSTYVYNANGQLAGTRRHASALDPVRLASLLTAAGEPASITLAGLNPVFTAADAVSWNLYDSDGRLAKTVDALGYVSQTVYDGAGRVIATIGYANPIANVAALHAGSLPADASPLPDASQDRRTRHFHDADGLRIASLDAEGYLTSFEYDGAGRLIHTCKRASACSGDLAGASLAALMPAATAADIHAWTLYDAQDRIIASVDGEGYLTENTWDASGNRISQIRYGDQALQAPAAISANTTLANLRPGTGSNQITQWTYTDLNQVATQTDAFGSVTRHTWDSMGNLVQQERAYGDAAQARTLRNRYDRLGRLTAALSGEGSAALAALGNNPGQTQIDAVWAQYGVQYAYDHAGRRSAMTDAAGKRTLWFYDAEGQLTCTINALGEVEQRNYDAQQRLIDVVRYANRLPAATLAALTGGLHSAALASALQALADASRDSRLHYEYTVRGELQRQTDELGYVTQTEFNAFGEQSAQISALPGNGTSRSVSRYDRRGLLLQRTDDQGASRLNLTRNSAYDAFGRLWRSEDAAGNISTRSYDRNGRLVLSTDRNGSGTTWSYDAFDRVLTQTDALGNRTTTRYDDASHSMTVTSAEGVVLRTTRNRHGEVSQVSDGNGVLTIHTYDRDGHLTSSINSGLGAGESSSYDAAGRISSHNDARGVPTRYAYDAANRVLSRIVDPDGLALQTRYEYDARGRQVRITEPSGRVTLTDYDARGQVVLVTVDPDGANLRTRYQYDPAGRTVEVSTGWGSEQPASTRYVYDNLGRRIQEIRDPDGAHLVTSYRYDQAGFLVARTDASHRTTRYVNDAEGRVLWEVDAGGGVTANTYDSAGRLRMQRRYSVPLSLAGLGEELTAASIHPQAAASDAVSYTVYDRDGRVRYQVNGAGEVSQRQYDANGNVIVRITHANRLDAAGLAAVAAGAAPAAPAASALDRIERMAYDPGNRLVYRADALGALSEWVYDNNGQVVLSRRYSNTITPGAAFSVQSVAAAARRSAADQVDRTVYDNAGRALYRIDALGGVTGYLYNAAGDIRSTTRYASAIAVSDLGNMPAAATVAARLNPSVGADRTTSNLYDSAQRLVYSIDALGYVTGQRYASDGTLASTTRYASAINAASSVSVLAMNAALAARPEAERAQDRTTSWSYDAAGRLLRSTDAIGQSETYAYDGAGRKTAHTDKAGQTWTWQYDAAGRLAAELSPLVSASVSGSSGGSGLWRMVVLTTCDGAGRVISRTEGALAASASFSGNAADLQQARTTTYSYDAAGRQTGITYPAVEVYGQGTLNPQTTLWFDAHGNAIASRDVGGRYRYQLYDALGQVCYEVDAEGYITGYQRDAFGALTRLTRYGARLDNAQAYGAGGIGAAQLQTFLAGVSHAADRIVSTEYDALGRVQRVIEPQVYVFDQNAVGATGFDGARVTETTYNALGDVLRTDSHARKAADGTPGTLAATTFFRYDLLGRKSAELAVFQRSAAASQAYATTYRYDAHDQVIARTEYDAAVSLADAAWNAVSGMAYSEPATRGNADRMTVSTYDALGRMTSDTRVNVANGESGGTRLYSDLTTRYTYDGAGNQASVTDASGQTTFTWHDALGRVTAIGTLALAAGPDAQDPPVSPLTEFELDIYGNAVRRTDYAGGAERIGANGYVARVDPGRDRVTRIVYDQSGHARARTDAEGNQVDTDYDVYGRVARVRQYVSDDSGAYVAETLSEYDALGRESAVTTRRLDHGVASQAVTRGTLYNAFGEISAHTVNGSAYDYFDYDPAGRLWRSNSGDGVDKVYLHDAAGRQSAEIRSALRDLRAERDAATVAAAPAAELVRSETAYDLLGHVSARKLPTRYAQEIGSVSGSTVAAPRLLALQSAGVDLQVTAAAHQEWRDTSEGTSGPVWVGTNQVDLSWSSLAGLGAGEVRVELHYNGNSVDPAAPPATLIRSFGAAQAQSGARLSWEGAPLHAFDRIVVQKKDVWGNWAVLIDRSGSGDYGSLVRIHAPAELGTALRLRYRAAGAANWSTADAQHGLLHFGDTLVFDASALAEGNYDYVVEQQGATAAGWTVLDQGSIGLTSPAARRDVARLFVAILNRAPDAGAMARYVGALQNGSMTLAAIAHELYASAESQALGLYWSAPGVQKPATDFILNFYDVVLGRQPGQTDGQGLPELGADEIAYWQNRLAALAGDRAAVLLEMIGAIAAYRYDGGASTVGRDAQAWFDNKVRVGLMYAIDCAGYVPGDARAVLSGVTAEPASVVIPAAIRQRSLYHNQVAQLYVLLFNRAPEGDGLNYWTGRLAGNEVLASVAQAMYQSAVALGAYPADASAAQIISNIYNQALGRAPDAAGLAAWCARMDSPGVSRGQVLVEMIAAINAYGGTDPVAQASYRLFVNKSAVAVYYSTLSHSNLALPEQQVQAAGDVLANVTASATVLESVRAAAALASQQAADALAAHLAALALPAPTQAEVDELQAAVPASTAVSDITRLYVLLFNRAPDLDGFNYWLARRQGGESMEQIAEGFYTSGQQLGLLPTQDAGQSATIIRQIYAGALGRAAPPDADVDYWANRLAAAIASPSGYARGKVFIDLLRSVQTYTGTLPEALSAVRLFANKVALAGTYVALGGKDGEVPAGTPLYGRPAGFAWTLMDKVSASDFSSAAAAAQTFLDNARAELNAAQAQLANAAVNTASNNAANASADWAAADMQARQAQQDASLALSAAAAAASTQSATATAQARADILNLYVALYRAAPTLANLNSWTDKRVNQNQTLAQIADNMLAGGTPKTNYPTSLSNADFVTRIYSYGLNRVPDSEGLNYWSGQLASGALTRGGVASAILSAASAYGGIDPVAVDARRYLVNTVAGYAGAVLGSAASEVSNTSATLSAVQPAWNAASSANSYSSSIKTQVAQLWLTVTGQNASVASMNTWGQQLAGGSTPITVASAMLATGSSLYTGLGNGAFVDRLYLTTQNRLPDAGGRAYWQARLDGGESRGSVTWNFIAAVSGYNGTDPAGLAGRDSFNGKVSASLSAFSSEVGSAQSAYDSALAAYNAALAVQNALQAVFNCASKAVSAIDAQNSASTSAATAAAAALARDNAIAAAQGYATPGAPVSSDARLEIGRIYALLYNRAPSATELNNWVLQRALKPAAQIVSDMLAGDLASGLGAMTNTNFVKSLYANALNRANPASADINYWTAQISSYGRGQMAMNLLGATAGYNGTDSQGLASAVFFNNRVAAYMDAFVGDPRTAQDAANAALAAAQKKIGTAFYPTQGSATRLVETTQNGLHHLWVTQLIGALLGRAPSVAEARAWVARFASLPAGGNPGPFATVAQEMLADPTLGAQYAASGSAGSATNSAFFSKLYNLALGRSAVASDPGFAADVNWWVGNTAGRTRGQALELFLNTVLDYANGNVLGLAAQAYCNHNALSGLLTTASVAATQKIARDAAVSAAARQLDVALDVKAALDGMAADSLFATGLQGVRENPPGAIVQYGATPQIWQTVDRWGNVLSVTDERNSAWVTRHAWDASDRLIGTIEADGSTTASYYDAAGRVIATQDGRGGVTRLRYDGNGNLVQETHADGGIVAYRVDGFGQVVQQRDAAGVLTVYDYDRLGRRISSARGLGPGVQSWHLVNATGAGAAAVADDSAPLPETVTYNALGQRIRVTNSAGETQRFGYDVRGNLVSAIDGLGRQTRYGHSALGVKISEQRGNGSNGESSSWNVDAFGRVQSVTVSVINDGLSQSHQTVYSYNRLGLVTRQTNAARGQDLAFGYDHASGLLVEIADRAQAATAGIVRLTRYAYDAAGNRIREKTSAVDASGLETDIAQDNHIGYDRRGRVSEIADGRYHVRHVYDANGNRVEVLTDYLREKNAARPQDGDERISLHAYNAFDAMNRQTIVDGISDGAQGAMISHIGNQVVGQEIVYDSAGKRLMVRQWGKRIVDMGGSYRVVDDYSSETYGYDGAGRLTDIYRDGLNAEARLYDKAGRVVQQGPGENSGAALAALAAAGVDVSRQFNSYDAAGDLIFQTVKNSDGSLGHIVDNNFRDELGRLRKYNLDRYGQGGYHSEYVYRYAGFDADQVEAISVHRNGESATTTNVFDANGHTVAVEATNSPGSARSLVTDAQGKVLRRTQDGHVYTSLIVNGELIGSASDGAALVPDSFLSNYVPVTDAALSGAPTGYVVQAGDTLQGIARALWGNASLWYVIADANALGTQTLNAGDVLRIPVRPNTVYAGADTFRPYDAARAIGAITPVIAAPGEQSCGLAQVFVMAVTAVVSAYTAGLLSGVGGTLLETVQAGLGVAAGGGTGIAGAGFAGAAGSALGVGGTLAVSAAVGSVAGQLTGMALGVQQKFDWRSVAFSALSAGVAPELERFGAGVGGALASATDSRWLGVAAQAALGNVATQGLSIVTGQQPGFSWRKVVASALGATVGEALRDKLGSGFGGRLSGRLAVGMTAALARGGRVAAGAVVADAFGNALGNSIAETDWSGTARQAVSTSAREQAQDFAREETRFARNAAASPDDGQLDLAGGDFARMDRALGHAADAVWAVAGREGQDAPYPSDINGLDLPAGYPIDLPDPLGEEEGGRLLRRMRDAAIERAAAQREAAMRAANEASVAGLNNRDNPATYRSASAGYRAARYLRDMANFVPDDFPAPRATRYTQEDGLADPNYRLAESALRSEGAADAKYMAMARERNARVEKYNQSLRRPWADYIAPGKYAMEFYNLYGVGIEWTVGENGNLDEIKFSIGLGVSRHFSRTDLPAPQALRGGAATYKNELYPGLATQPAIQGEARLGVSATGSLSFLSFSADLPGVAVGLSSRTKSMFYGQFEPAAWAVDPLKALRPSSWMFEVSGRVALEGSYRFKQPKPLEPMPLVRPK